jgi:DNA polymerase I-like protein with 3'-5' exonuclease and polymerase domains
MNQLPLFEPDSEWVAPTDFPFIPTGVQLAVDTETRDDGLSNERGPGWVTKSGYITGISVAWNDTGCYIPLRHPDTPCLSPETAARWIQDTMRRAETVAFHNQSYDQGWLSVEGAAVPESKTDDTQIMSVMLDENQDQYSLDACCKRYGVDGKDEQLLKEAAATYSLDAKKEMWKLPARHVGPYAIQDAIATLKLARVLRKKIEEQDLVGAYRLEMSLIPMILEMRRRGIRIDEEATSLVQSELRARRDETLREIKRHLCWRKDVTMQDIMSPTSLEVMFNAEGIPFPRTPKTAKGSFDSNWMRKSTQWLPQAVAAARSVNDLAEKFIGNYILGSMHLGRIHAEIHQLRDGDSGTRSYRLSYSNPPLQQIPTKTEDGRLIRKAFIAEKDELWFSADYCFDDQTEILTEEGWKFFSALNQTERVAQWHDNGSISWVTPTDYYSGEPRLRTMIHVHGTRKTDFMVTEDHSCIVKKSGVPTRIKAREFGKNLPFSTLYHSGILPGEDVIEPALLQLVVALQADAADRNGTWRFYISKERKKTRLIELLDRAGIPYRHELKANGEKDGFVIDDNPTFRQYLSPGKVFNKDLLSRLAPEFRQLFLRELRYWDGTYSENKGAGWTYGGTTLENVETVSFLASISGIRSKISPLWRVSDDRKWCRTIHLYDDHGRYEELATVDRVRYTGRVYCVTVPTHAILVRRNGRVVVSGQSQQEPRLAVHFAALCGLEGSDAAVSYYLENEDADFHQMVSDLTGVPRGKAKIINLGLMYGMGLKKLAASLGLSEPEALVMITQYHERMPFVKKLTEFCSQRAEKRGFIRLIDGARCRFDLWEQAYNRTSGDGETWYSPPRSKDAAEEHWPGKRIRRAYTHKAMNRLIQGSAARQTKMAMLACWREGIVPKIQMHDEMGFGVASPVIAEKAMQLMRDVIPLRVPMKVDGQYGHSWGQASEEAPKGVAAPSFEEMMAATGSDSVAAIIARRQP